MPSPYVHPTSELCDAYVNTIYVAFVIVTSTSELFCAKSVIFTIYETFAGNSFVSVVLSCVKFQSFNILICSFAFIYAFTFPLFSTSCEYVPCGLMLSICICVSYCSSFELLPATSVTKFSGIINISFPLFSISFNCKSNVISVSVTFRFFSSLLHIFVFSSTQIFIFVMSILLFIFWSVIFIVAVIVCVLFA